MNSADRFELDRIREDQATIHRAVESLDRRIHVLSRSVAITSVPRELEVKSPVVAREEREVAVAPPPLVSTVSASPPVPKMAPPPASVLPPPLPKPAPEPPPPISTTPPPPTAAKPAPVLPIDPPSKSTDEPLELRVGTYWMARIGIVILLTGLVFLGNYAYHRWVGLLGPGGKLALLTLAGAGLGGLGLWMERSRESLKNFGRVLMAGGAATVYYTAYAAHFVEGLRIIESPIAGGLLLLFLAGGIVWFAERRRSEAVALPAILLSYYTAAINPAGGFTLFSNLLLAGAVVYFLTRYQWSRLSFASLLATYGSYAFWRFHQWVEIGATGDFGMGPTYLASYWLIFTAAVFLVGPKAIRGAERTALLTLNNAAYFAFAAHHFLEHRPDAFWMLAIAYGSILMGLAALAAWRFPEERGVDGSYLTQGLVLVTVGLNAKLTGPQMSIVLAIESLALLTCGTLRHGWLYRVGAAICAFGAFALGLWHVLSDGHPLPHAIPLVVLLLAGAWWAKFLKKDTRTISPAAMSYSILGFTLLGALLWQSVAAP